VIVCRQLKITFQARRRRNDVEPGCPRR